MKTIPLFAAIITFVALAPVVQAESKASKPTVCVDFRVYGEGAKVVGVCHDGKKPAVFSTWSKVRFVDRDGKPADFVLGYR